MTTERTDMFMTEAEEARESAMVTALAPLLASYDLDSEAWMETCLTLRMAPGPDGASAFLKDVSRACDAYHHRLAGSVGTYCGDDELRAVLGDERRTDPDAA